MATLPIYLEVEVVAVDPVLIALKKMPGILDLGEGPGCKHRRRTRRASTTSKLRWTCLPGTTALLDGLVKKTSNGAYELTAKGECNKEGAAMEH